MSSPRDQHTLDEHAVVVRGEGQTSSRVADEAVILHLGSGTYFGLDEVGARIWELIAEPRRVEDVRDRLSEEYEVEPERCAADLLRLLGELAEHDLIEIRAEDGEQAS